jgi:lipoic acid synthetase
MIPATKRKNAFHPDAETPAKKPTWLKVRLPSHQNFFQVRDILKKHQLHTICQSAKCPNIAECWEQKTATFLILGDICTRRCAFCAVKKGIPAPSSLKEPFQVAEAVTALGLHYAVITSVTRDDLADSGASFFAETIRSIKMRSPETKVEVLIPDFKGEEEGVDTVVQAQPDVVNHNLETPEAIYPEIDRPLENYQRSLKVLRRAKEKGGITKSGLMVGLGEKEEEIFQTLSDLRQVSCDLLTIGQYLQPTSASVPVRRYYTPQEFEQLKIISLDFGFKDVVAGPLVRSSFHASQLYQSLQNMV